MRIGELVHKNGVFNTLFIEKISQKDKMNKTESDAQKTRLAQNLANWRKPGWRQAPTLAPGAKPSSRRQCLESGARPVFDAFSKIR